jgi:TolB-like protein/DNA-binding winged helix-turn-helix (wHTH) protein
MSAPKSQVYEFGDFRMDAGARRLTRQDGTTVSLTPRVFDTLRYLVENSGTVLEKERLMEAVWPDSVVEENNLSQNISTLRRVFGESPGSARYIVTVPGRGYRFVAEVRSRENGAQAERTSVTSKDSEQEGIDRVLAAPTPSRPGSIPNRRPILLATLAVLALSIAVFVFWPKRPSLPIPEKSVAVLPFDNLSGDPENAYFADGIKDEILTRLSKIAALKVISRTSTQKFKSAPDNVREIAQQLGVANILKGSVQKSGETVRVTVQLINAQSDTHLWAETYDRKLADMFQVETDIAQRVATALEATLTGAEKRSLKARPTVSVEAHQAYLKGRIFWDKRTGDGFAKAGAYFQQAIAIDPDYAAAYAGLSDVYQFAAYDVVSRRELYAKARAAAQKAIALDETLAEPHASLGLLAMNYDWDWATAEREFKQAIELNPNYATAHHWYAEYLTAVGRPDESVAEIKRARELDPLSLIINTDMGKLLYFSRRYNDAMEQLRETLRMDPDFSDAHVWLGAAFATTGLYEEAIAESKKIRDNTWALGWLGYVYGTSGQPDEARKVLTELKRLEIERPLDPHVLLSVYLGLGDKDQAFACLEKEYETRSVGLTSLKVNPWYDSLRSDPRFADLLRRTNLAP